jgi:hypothetical protein
MAKIRAIDQAVVITSSLTNEQLSKAIKYFPEVLTLKAKNDEDKLVPVFVVSQGTKGDAGKYGITFPNGPKDEKASLTVSIDKMSANKRTEFVKDSFGKILVNLNKIEAQYAGAEKAFDEEYKALDKDIVVE